MGYDVEPGIATKTEDDVERNFQREPRCHRYCVRQDLLPHQARRGPGPIMVRASERLAGNPESC